MIRGYRNLLSHPFLRVGSFQKNETWLPRFRGLFRAPALNRALGAAVRVHRQLGPGLLESAYQACLATELEKDGLRFDREVRLPVVYDGVQIDAYYRPDFVLERQVVVEIKSVKKLEPIFTAQTLTYMRIGKYPVGLLINFNAPYLGDGAIKRLVC